MNDAVCIALYVVILIPSIHALWWLDQKLIDRAVKRKRK